MMKPNIWRPCSKPIYCVQYWREQAVTRLSRGNNWCELTTELICRFHHPRKPMNSTMVTHGSNRTDKRCACLSTWLIRPRGGCIDLWLNSHWIVWLIFFFDWCFTLYSIMLHLRWVAALYGGRKPVQWVGETRDHPHADGVGRWKTSLHIELLFIKDIDYSFVWLLSTSSRQK